MGISPRRDSYSRDRDPPRRQRSRSRSPRRDRDRHERDSRDSGRRRDERERGEREREQGRDRYGDHSNGRDSDRRGGPAPSAVAAPAPVPTGGDGGWGSRRPPGSPGRPSLGLPSQSALANPDGEEGPGAVAVVKPIEPNYAPSGALAAETNTFQGVVLKYNEPPEARKPVRSWRMYVFKGKDQVGECTCCAGEREAAH